jgi:endo-1,4-beta-xylanase
MNVTFGGGVAWTNDISHGEMVRDGYDQTLEIDPANLQFLYQGADPSLANVEYSQIPYRLGLLTQTQ